eukprot:COSAG02_NODE_11012_length_1811_cov_3.105724_3_plen_34_part_01
MPGVTLFAIIYSVSLRTVPSLLEPEPEPELEPEP